VSYYQEREIGSEGWRTINKAYIHSSYMISQNGFKTQAITQRPWNKIIWLTSSITTSVTSTLQKPDPILLSNCTTVHTTALISIQWQNTMHNAGLFSCVLIFKATTNALTHWQTHWQDSIYMYPHDTGQSIYWSLLHFASLVVNVFASVNCLLNGSHSLHTCVVWEI